MQLSMTHAFRDVQQACIDTAWRKPLDPNRFSGWSEIHVLLAIDHGVGPWLYRWVAGRECTGLREPFVGLLRQQYLQSALGSVAREEILGSLLPVLDAAGIPCHLLKGSYLAANVYETPSLRTMTDVDILVPEHQFQAAVEALRGLGYLPCVEAFGGVQSRLASALSFKHPSRPGMAVDLHRELRFLDRYLLPPEMIRSEARESTLCGRPVFFLTPELNFIHIALHVLGHASMLRDWLDLHLIVTGTDFDWDRFTLLASDSRVMRPLKWVLDDLARVWNTPVPLRVQQTLDSYSPRRMEDPIIRGRFRYLWRFLVRMGRVKGLGSKIEYLGSTALPSRDFRMSVVGDTRWSVYVKSKIRYFTALWKRW